MTCNKCFKSKCCIYFLLILNILKNIFVLTILLLICYSISILNFFQIIYLILSIISLLILTFYSFYKFLIIITGKSLKEESLKQLWKLANLPAFLFIGIALIYDIINVPSTSGIPWIFIYYLLFVIMSAVFIGLSYLDYTNIQKQIEISRTNLPRFFLSEELELKVMTKHEQKN